MTRLAALSLLLVALAGCGVKNEPRLSDESARPWPGTYPEGATPRDQPENIFTKTRP